MIITEEQERARYIFENATSDLFGFQLKEGRELCKVCNKGDPAIFYMFKEALDDKSGRMMNELIPRDEYEYVVDSQTVLNTMFTEYMNYKVANTTDKELEFYYEAIKYSTQIYDRYLQTPAVLNYYELTKVINSNNKKLLNDTAYRLATGASMILYWRTLLKSSQYKKYAQEAKNWTIKAMLVKNPPKTDDSIMELLAAQLVRFNRHIVAKTDYEPWKNVKHNNIDIESMRRDALERTSGIFRPEKTNPAQYIDTMQR